MKQKELIQFNLIELNDYDFSWELQWRKHSCLIYY